MDIRDIIARNVRMLRHSREWDQAELAHRATINRSHVSAMETAKNYARADIIEKVAKAFAIEPHALLDPKTSSFLNVPEDQKRVVKSKATAAARRPVRHVKRSPTAES